MTNQNVKNELLDTQANAAGVGIQTRKKIKPTVVILDTSGSMTSDMPIVDQALKDLLPLLKAWNDDESKESELVLQVLSFNSNVSFLVGEHGKFVALDKITAFASLSAGGGTSMGQAIEMAAGSLDAYYQAGVKYAKPVLVLMSDGEPTDCSKLPMAIFDSSKILSRSTRMAVAFGPHANRKVLESFLSRDMMEIGVFEAQNASELVEQLHDATLSAIAGERVNRNSAQSLIGAG